MGDEFFHNENLHLLQYMKTKEIIGERKNKRTAPKGTAQPAMNTTVTFDLEKNGENDFLNDLSLVIVLSACSGSGGSFIRFVNAVALFIFRYFRIVQGGDVLFMVDPDAVYQNIKYYATEEQFAMLSQQLAIGTSGTRDTLGASAQTLVIPLSLLFPGLFSKPLDMGIQSKSLKLECVLRDNVRHVLQTDKTAGTFTITDIYLDEEHIEPKSSIVEYSRRDYITNNRMSTPQYDVNHIISRTPVDSGATTVTVKMDDLEGKDIIDIQCFLRASALVDTVDASDYTDTFIAPTSWNLKDGNQYNNFGIQSDISKTYYDRVLLPRLGYRSWDNIISGTASGNDFVISFANQHTSEEVDNKVYHGSKYFDGKSNKLTVNFSALAAQTDLVVIMRQARRYRINKEKIELIE